MKQETLNTFSEGLNYDLNPLVTPNNVLTDNVNGTFITFNGNELSLQNDAGNTLINIMSVARIYAYDPTASYRAATQDPDDHPVGDKIAYTIAGEKMRCYICVADTSPGESPVTTPGKWREYIVRLSPGFYPLAVKEYGGVLYIVSGRDVIRLATTHIPGTAYALDDFVNTGLTTIPIKYYKSLKYNNISDLTDSTAWEYMGNGRELDQIRANYNEIEFGSYPSPENYGEEGSDPEATIINQNQIGFPKVLSEIVFRPGEYVMFTDVLGKEKLDLEWITRYHGTNTIDEPHYRFYVARLYQQLTSGLIDLTTSIDAAFARRYNAGNATSVHWLFDTTFKYYCPFLYKGKLALSLEIIDLLSFNVTIESITFDSSFVVKLLASAEFIYNYYTIWVEGFYASIDNLFELVGTPNIAVEFVSDTTNNSPTIAEYLRTRTVTYRITISNIHESNLGKTLKYEVIPKFNWTTSQTSDSNNQLPENYIEEYTKIGSVILLTDMYAVKFPLDKARQLLPGLTECDLIIPGYRVYNALVLTDALSNYIDPYFEQTETPWIFIEKDHGGDLPFGAYYYLGEYTIDPNTFKPVLYAWYNSAIPALNKNIVVSVLENTVVRVEDPTCLEGAFINLTITVNMGLLANYYVIIEQEGSNVHYTPYWEPTRVHQVLPNIPVLITITPFGSSADQFEIINDVITVSTEDLTCTYALIGRMMMFPATPSGYSIGTKYVIDAYPGISMTDSSGNVTNGQLLPTADGSLFADGGTPEWYEFTGNYRYNFSPKAWTLGSYKNIENTIDYVHLGSNNVVFKKSGQVEIVNFTD